LLAKKDCDRFGQVFLLEDIRESICFSLKEVHEGEVTITEAILPFDSGFEGDLVDLGVRCTVHISVEKQNHASVELSEPEDGNGCDGLFFHESMKECAGIQILPSFPKEASASGGYFESTMPRVSPQRLGYAYATVVNCGRPVLAHKMVTHNWGNKFAHLMGAVLADALHQET